MTLDKLYKGLTLRILTIAGCSCMLMLTLLCSLWNEQLRSGKMHNESISKQSIRRIRIPPIRGRIISSDGQIFTENEPSYDVNFHIHELRQPGKRGRKKTVKYLYRQLIKTAKIIGRELTITNAEVNRHFHVYPALPFKAFTNLNEIELARLYEIIPGIPGLEISTSIKRIYPMNDICAHLIGFVGNQDPNLIEGRDAYSYYLPELTGRTGLERIFNDRLKGKGGSKLARVDSLGFFYEETVEKQEAVSGDDIILTIDSKAQFIAQKMMTGRRGAFVLLDCNKGAVLAIASSPTYNLNEISKTYSSLASDSKNRPLVNRAISGGYMPGSIIKPITALALLENNIANPTQLYTCVGYSRIGNAKIRCAHISGHGEINIYQAIESSCNPYFIDKSLSLGINRLRILFEKAGIGQNTGFEIPASGSRGLIPSRRLKLRRQRQNWNAFDTGLVSIGQGLISMSPLQAAMFTAAIANGGTVYQPSIIHSIIDSKGNKVRQFSPSVNSRLNISKQSLHIVQQGMINAIKGEHATGYQAGNSKIELAGKTGTAEVGFGRNKRKNTWFVCYGPVDNPVYAMAILIENGDSGGDTCAPLARLFFESFL